MGSTEEGIGVKIGANTYVEPNFFALVSASFHFYVLLLEHADYPDIVAYFASQRAEIEFILKG